MAVWRAPTAFLLLVAVCCADIATGLRFTGHGTEMDFASVHATTQQTLHVQGDNASGFITFDSLRGKPYNVSYDGRCDALGGFSARHAS